MKYYLVSFDCESTGLSTYQDQIVEFGAAIALWDAMTGEMVDLAPFAKQAKPTEKVMGRRAEEITGITMDSLQDKPPIRSVLDAFMVHLDTICEEGTPRLLLSYNGFSYDIPLMVAEILRYGGCPVTYFRQLKMENTIDILPFGRSCLDTSTLLRKANGTCSYRLGDVYQAVCKCPLQNAHGALADSNAVLSILRAPDICTAFQETVSGTVESTHRKNPMVLVRAIMARITKRTAAPSKTGSKRVLDMVCAHVSKKKRIRT
tara:strand:- start:1819 stop:2601 length:783 start_codon:yes stop_codon:yes gene_type:complete